MVVEFGRHVLGVTRNLQASVAANISSSAAECVEQLGSTFHLRPTDFGLFEMAYLNHPQSEHFPQSARMEIDPKFIAEASTPDALREKVQVLLDTYIYGQN